MQAGRELDALVAEKIMGWTYRTFPDGVCPHIKHWHGPNDESLLPPYSTSIEAAWQVVEKLAAWAGNFSECDGFFHLTYADSADHAGENTLCQPGESKCDSDDNDLTRWSAHIHPNHCCEHTTAPELWWKSELKWFCCRGETAPHAICLAALKAVGVEVA